MQNANAKNGKPHTPVHTQDQSLHSLRNWNSLDVKSLYKPPMTSQRARTLIISVDQNRHSLTSSPGLVGPSESSLSSARAFLLFFVRRWLSFLRRPLSEDVDGWLSKSPSPGSESESPESSLVRREERFLGLDLCEFAIGSIRGRENGKVDESSRTAEKTDAKVRPNRDS